ncbi:MAG: glutathione S-transferase [Kordiimonadaceae bacterium]|nr:glutathione S-transferase [Kordiimonadaceae bacterium]MBO6567278.1 glutathione S-transferase [Kordiimonadaceae bacterium]MBO6963508.1 glutathione S-transferase [Kordiimonadaceae bacterium]
MSLKTPVTLYGAPPSLYSGKARSYLRKAGIDYIERLQCHPDYASRILPAIGRFVIPVLEHDQTIVQDTTEIIDYLEENGDAPIGVYPETPKQKIISLILEVFGDEGLLRPAMHYRWNFPEENDYFISMEFGRFMNPQADDDEARQLAGMPKAAMQKYLPGLGITEDTIPEIERTYEDLLAALDAHFLKHPYLLGGKPTIADFGLYGPMYAHLARDPKPEMLMKTTANRVWRWVERMTAPDLDKPEFSGLPDATVAGDAIPDTLKTVLKLVGRDHAPEVTALVDFVNGHLESGPEAGSPVITDATRRVLGRITIPVGDMEVPVGARHFTLWMLQRVHDAYDALGDNDKAEVDTLLEELGLEAYVHHRPSRRIKRVNYAEVWA